MMASKIVSISAGRDFCCWGTQGVTSRVYPERGAPLVFSCVRAVGEGPENKREDGRHSHSRGQRRTAVDCTCMERPTIEPRRPLAPTWRSRSVGGSGEKAEAAHISMAAGRSARRMLQAIFRSSQSNTAFSPAFLATLLGDPSQLVLRRDFLGPPRLLETVLGCEWERMDAVYAPSAPGEIALRDETVCPWSKVNRHVTLHVRWIA